MIWGYHYFWKHPFEDVFPIQDGDFPASYVCLLEGMCLGYKTFYVPNCCSYNLCRQASSERQVASMEITKVTGFFPPFLVVLVGE